MSLEIDWLNTYPVCGQERNYALFHLETVRGWQGTEAEVPVYDIPDDVRVAMAMARLAKERLPRVMPDLEIRHAA